MNIPRSSKPHDLKPKKPKHKPRFLTVAFIAGDLGYCEKTVRRWIEAGLLPHHRIGRQFRVAEDDYRAFLALRRNA